MVFTMTDAINRYVEDRQSIREPDAKWHPSGIFGCLRQTVYQYRGTPETNPRDHKSKRTLWLGTQIHEWLQDAVRSHPEIIEAYTEVHIDISDLNIVGDADVVYRTDRGWELGEVKSIGTFALKAAQRPDAGLPKDDHRKQAMTYMYALRTLGSVAKPDCQKHPGGCPVLEPLGDALNRICFAYVEKDSLQPNEVYLDWDEGFVPELVDLVEQLSAYANDANSLPPRLPFGGKNMDTRDWRCKYCPFADRCWQVDPKEVPVEESVW